MVFISLFQDVIVYILLKMYVGMFEDSVEDVRWSTYIRKVAAAGTVHFYGTEISLSLAQFIVEQVHTRFFYPMI